MKAKIENNILTLKSDIPFALVEDKFPLKLRDERGDVKYVVSYGENACISKYTIQFNNIIDDKLAVTIVLPVGTEVKDVKKAFGLGIVAASAYIPELLCTVQMEQEAIDSCFE